MYRYWMCLTGHCKSRSLMRRPVGQLERIEPYHHVSAQAIPGMLSLSQLRTLRPDVRNRDIRLAGIGWLATEVDTRTAAIIFHR